MITFFCKLLRVLAVEYFHSDLPVNTINLFQTMMELCKEFGNTKHMALICQHPQACSCIAPVLNILKLNNCVIIA